MARKNEAKDPCHQVFRNPPILLCGVSRLYLNNFLEKGYIMDFIFPYTITKEDGEFLIAFPDIHEAITSTIHSSEIHESAYDCLVAALGGYIDDRRNIPEPSPKSHIQEVVVIPQLMAAKLSLYIAMRREDMTNVDLAERLNVDEKIVRRMLDLDHATKIQNLTSALQNVFSESYQLRTSLEIFPDNSQKI